MKEAINKDIEANKRFGSGCLLSEISYCKRLGVSRMTVRKAVDELISEGKLQRIPGKGLEILDGPVRPDKQLYKRLAFVIRFSEDDDFFSRMVLACTQVANLRGYSYSIYNITHWRTQDIFGELLKTEVDGVLFTYYIHEPQTGNFQNLINRGIPLVMIDNIPAFGDYPSVLSNDINGGYIACRHLLSKGHKNILFITDEIEEYTQARRLEGYVRAVKESGLPSKSLKVLKVKGQVDLMEKIRDMFKSGIQWDAVASISDGYVIDTYHVLKDMGIKVPDHVALMGYGDSVAGRLLEVPLSTIGMPVFEMGMQACQMLIDYLEGKGSLNKRILDVKLVTRQSTG